LATASAAPTAASGTTLSGLCCATCGRATSRTGGRTALLPRGGLNGNDYLHQYQRCKNHCQGND
jgi:hypothetical protein